MATQSVEDIATIVTTLVAVTGVIIAGMGLWTWKKQIRWQQGRGLAVGLLQSLRAVETQMRRRTDFSSLRYDETKPESQRLANHLDAHQRASEYLDELSQKIEKFDLFVSESLIVWGEDLSERVSELRDLEQTLKCAIRCGVEAINPGSKPRDRQASDELARDCWAEINGRVADCPKLGDKISDIRERLEKHLLAKGLK